MILSKFYRIRIFFHPSWHITHDFLIHEVLDWFGMCFRHLWGFIIFGKSTFLSFMSCLHTTRFYLWRMYYLCTLLFIIIQWKDTLQYSSLHSCDSVSFLLSIFIVYACKNYLNNKIYFLCFFLASLLIELELLFLHGIKALLHTICEEYSLQKTKESHNARIC